jgi:hypothetical protein
VLGVLSKAVATLLRGIESIYVRLGFLHARQRIRMVRGFKATSRSMTALAKQNWG